MLNPKLRVVGNVNESTPPKALAAVADISGSTGESLYKNPKFRAIKDKTRCLEGPSKS